jgi:hypothetical protein
MVSLHTVEPLNELRLRLEFDDGVMKIVNLCPMLPDSPLTRPLKDPEFFKLVKIYPDGEGVYWPNDFDLGTDMLRFYAEGEIVVQEEVEHFAN